MMNAHIALTGLIIFLASGPALADTLHLTVNNIITPGVIYVAVYDHASAFEGKGAKYKKRGPTKDVFLGRSKAVEPGSIYEMMTVPAGVYAISIFVDKNQNGKLDTRSFIPLPTEQFGFSQDAIGRFGPPSFKAASFTVEGLSDQIIRLRGK